MTFVLRIWMFELVSNQKSEKHLQNKLAIAISTEFFS